jgi:hypothetical protein
LQNHGLIFAEHFAAGDSEQQAIADLAGGAGDGNANGAFHGEDAPCNEVSIDVRHGREHKQWLTGKYSTGHGALRHRGGHFARHKCA